MNSPPTEIAVAILRWGNRVLVRPRPSADTLLAGALEFPGGRIEVGESPSAAARREFAEETGAAAPPLRPFDIVLEAYPDRVVRIHFFIAEVAEVPAPESGDWRWEEIAYVAQARLPAANRAIVQRLLDEAPYRSP